MLPFILPALHALDQKLHLYLIVFLVSVFGFLRYVPLFWIPIDGLLVVFIIICVLICYISWYVDLSTVNFAFSHVAYWFVLRIGTVISVVLLNHRRRYILLVAMAYLYVLQGGPSYVARAESLFMDIATVMAGRLGCWPGFARC